MATDPNHQIYLQARLTRDPRFDGRFFVGVKSTRIYCRPTCPVRTVKEDNVRYFTTAAAAAEAGFRPCLRCRPESAPGTPAWFGSSTTVSRALRIIGDTAIENEGVERLSERLGIGSRQLRRLFMQHLGASPLAVVKTRRLHFAKKLIDETNLPMSQIALVSGFGSVRRFNAAFRQTYNRTPSQIRRFGHLAAPRTENEYLFRLNYRPPFNWPSLLSFIGQRAIPGVEAVESGCYQRLISLHGHTGRLCVSLQSPGSALQVSISFPEPRWLFLIVERVRRMFDLAADPLEIAARLGGDPLLAKRIELLPGLRVPGCWDGFELAIRAILGQQVSVKGASTLAGRLVQQFGTPMMMNSVLTHLCPSPEVLAEADIARIGIPEKRAETIRALSRAVSAGRIVFDSIGNLDEFRTCVREIPGIGEWTAQYIMMRAFCDPDAFPASDLGLLRGASLEHPSELLERAEAWRPWRAYAAMYLWQGTSVENSKIESRTTGMVVREVAAGVPV